MHRRLPCPMRLSPMTHRPRSLRRNRELPRRVRLQAAARRVMPRILQLLAVAYRLLPPRIGWLCTSSRLRFDTLKPATSQGFVVPSRPRLTTCTEMSVAMIVTCSVPVLPGAVADPTRGAVD